MRNRFIISLVILIVALFCQYNTSEINAETFRSDQFGYIQLDEISNSVEIFKSCSTQNDRAIKIAECTVMKTTEKILVIDNHRSILENATNMILMPSHIYGADSLTVTVRIPSTTSSGCRVYIHPDCDNIIAKEFDKDGIAVFKFKKHEIDYRNMFSLWIEPSFNPFKCSTSWGDNETLSQVELPVYNHSSIFESSISCLDIILPNFSDSLFTKWVIVDDIVLKTDEGLIWRGMYRAQNEAIEVEVGGF